MQLQAGFAYVELCEDAHWLELFGPKEVLNRP
jgi:hypothetical protein